MNIQRIEPRTSKSAVVGHRHVMARRRRGSILILVVAMLVLVALMGTAMISTTRDDRFTTSLNTTNTKIAMLIEGVDRLAEAAILSDLRDGARFRPDGEKLPSATIASTYTNYDVVNQKDANVLVPSSTVSFLGRDTWLAARLPEVPDLSLPAHGTTNVPFWPAITSPLSGVKFESPYFNINAMSPEVVPPAPEDVVTYTQRTELVPDRIAVGANWYPAFRFGSAGSYYYRLAADADGDGVADSGLVRVPNGEVGDLTYFYGVRIIDNNSAINVNTALTSEAEFDFNRLVIPYSAGTTNRATGFFPDAVGLSEMLRSYVPLTAPNAAPRNLDARIPGGGIGGSEVELGALLKWRWNTQTDPPEAPDGVLLQSGTAKKPVADSGNTRDDFHYFSIGDADARLLAARPENPGFARLDSHMQRFSASDAAALAYKFCLKNTGVPRSALEEVFYQAGEQNASAPNPSRKDSLWQDDHIPTKPYALTSATAAVDWFNDSFEFSREKYETLTPVPLEFAPRRTLLTSYNPTSNVIPRRKLLAATPLVNGVLENTPLGGPAVPATIDQMFDYGPVATKVPINVAEFGDLWRGFYQTMSRSDGTTPFDDPTTVFPRGSSTAVATYRYPEIGGVYFQGSQFSVPVNLTGGEKVITYKPEAPPAGRELDQERNKSVDFVASKVTHPYYMFRSSMRGTAKRPLVMPPEQEMILRAAQAAVNAEAMRDPTNSDLKTPTKQHTIRLQAGYVPSIGTAPTLFNVNVTVFGIRPQPFITEVYANTNNGTPYLAVEICNPFKDDIDLADYRIVSIDRSSTGAASTTPALTVKHVANLTGTLVGNANQYGAPEDVGYKVLVSGAVAPAGAGTVANRQLVSGLAGVIPATGVKGLELVLVRGTGTASVLTTNDEPVDSFDFTGFGKYTPPAGGGPTNPQNPDLVASLAPPVPGTTEEVVWHYARPCGTPTVSTVKKPVWRFVYPGRYDGSKASRRQQGTRMAAWYLATDPGEPFAFVPPALPATNKPYSDSVGPRVPEVTLGKPNPYASYPQTFAIQLCQLDAPGFNGITTTGIDNLFPYGMFARNSDVMQVPFASAYLMFAAGPGPGGIAAGQLLEAQSLPMNFSFAEDGDKADDEDQRAVSVRSYTRPGSFSFLNEAGNPGTRTDQLENPGRFVPIICRTVYREGAALGDWIRLAEYDDADATGDYTYIESDATAAPVPPATTNPPLPKTLRYRWAMDLIDNFTVQAPSADYLPNVKPSLYRSLPTKPPAPTSVANTYKAAANGGTGADYESNNRARRRFEDLTPTEGLININTAPRRVLAQIPWLPPTTDLSTTGIADNYAIADMIIKERALRPFNSIFDLTRISEFQSLQDLFANQNALSGPGPDSGDFSPAFTGGSYVGDGVAMDFEERNLIISRVSNLITTRSDTFTVYIVVQGWRTSTLGTATPELVTTQRRAMIVDRSGVSDTDGSLKLIRIPAE